MYVSMYVHTYIIVTRTYGMWYKLYTDLLLQFSNYTQLSTANHNIRNRPMQCRISPMDSTTAVGDSTSKSIASAYIHTYPAFLDLLRKLPNLHSDPFEFLSKHIHTCTCVYIHTYVHTRQSHHTILHIPYKYVHTIYI